MCKGGLYARTIICPYLYIFVPHSLPHIINIHYYGLFVGVRPEEANFPYTMSPGSAEVLSGNTGVGLDVFDKIFAVEGVP